MTVILLRHGLSQSNTAGTLAGRSPGIDLTAQGLHQAQQLAQRLASLPIAHIVHSPLQRCVDTVAPLAAQLGLATEPDQRLIEIDYGDWTGKTIGELVKEPLWKVVQRHPSAAVFPAGEGLAQAHFRAVTAIRERDRDYAEQQGHDVLWVACSHGDIIKAVLADGFGIHLDGFQRIAVEPASLSVIRYAPTGAMVWRVNDTGTDLSALATPPKAADQAGAMPGGEVIGAPTADRDTAGVGVSADNGNAESPAVP